jgi:hypothetical protein
VPDLSREVATEGNEPDTPLARANPKIRPTQIHVSQTQLHRLADPQPRAIQNEKQEAHSGVVQPRAAQSVSSDAAEHLFDLATRKQARAEMRAA